MGVSYRYEGGGVWFDGLLGNAVLNGRRAGAVPFVQEAAAVAELSPGIV